MAPAPLPEMMACLLQPARYPHPVDQVSLIETHGAWVLLAGAFAYKIKKPVALSFMDFSTLDKRRQACEAELRVNRQFEPEAPAQRLYLSVLPITGTVANPVLGGDAADALEWAVQMRRFPECDRLDHVAGRQALTPDLLQGLARHVARVQSSAPVAAAPSSWGRADDVATFARDNFPPLPPLMPKSVTCAAPLHTVTPTLRLLAAAGYRLCHARCPRRGSWQAPGHPSLLTVRFLFPQCDGHAITVLSAIRRF